MNDASYQQKLSQEADLWGTVAEQQAAAAPPDWRYHRLQRQNVIMHTADIDALLSHIQPGMKTLELGCGAGWLTLAMGQRGAAAHGLDISAKAVEVGRAYYDSIKNEVPGQVSYDVADLNTLTLPPAAYDFVIAKGVLHHLVNLEAVIGQIHSSLKPGGCLWISDSAGDTFMSSALLASALMFVLPTEVSYKDKFSGLIRFGVHAPSRIKASIEAEGFSPFEGAGREHNWLELVTEQFVIEQRANLPSVTGYIAAQIKMSDRLALPLLKVLHAAELGLIRCHVLHTSDVLLYARKSI